MRRPGFERPANSSPYPHLGVLAAETFAVTTADESLLEDAGTPGMTPELLASQWQSVYSSGLLVAGICEDLSNSLPQPDIEDIG